MSHSMILLTAETADTATQSNASVAAEAAVEAAQNVVEEANAFLETLQSFIPTLVTFGINLIVAIIMLVVGRFLIKLILKIMGRALGRSKLDESVIKFLNSLVKTVLYIFLLIMICGRIGIETTSIIAIFTSASVAVGLALQGALSNFAGGLMILILHPFKVGDYIITDTLEGTVEQIDLFYTRLTTIDNKLVLLPNGDLTSSKITNVTAYGKRRVDVIFSISYTDDIDRARSVIQSVIDRCEYVLTDEPIRIIISELGAHSVSIQMRVWVETANYWDAYFFFEENVKKEFDKNGVHIPFNQLDVHVVDTPHDGEHAFK
ncbi:MAG: mechanosensitive ion channel [Lachnospiraceae bacterium]|nr:mechanosensitive ion channel [Lachnospiraceae bacterium]